MTSQEVAEKADVSINLVLRWARNNNVGFLGEGKRKVYKWTEEDLNKFLNRNKKVGWKKGRSRK